MAVGDIITAARYNNLQSRVATVMGVGSGDDGYGQNLNSSQVAVGANVQAIDINQLYQDMAAGRIHQTGSTPTEINLVTQNVDLVLDSDTINKKGVVQFENLATTLENDKFVAHPSQTTAEAAIAGTRTTQWNGTISHIIDVTFIDGNHQRHFFNAGGTIDIFTEMSGASSTKDLQIQQFLDEAQTLYLKKRFEQSETQLIFEVSRRKSINFRTKGKWEHQSMLVGDERFPN